MEAVFLKALNMSIAAGWLILAVAALRLFMKKAPRWAHCFLWLMVAVRLACPVSFESMWSLIPSGETVSQEIIYSPSPSINTGVPAINNAVNPVISESFTPNPAASANPLQIWIFIAAVVWILGVEAMFVYALASYWRLRRKVRAAVPAGSGIWVCDEIDMPFILGIVSPRIYLPSYMNEGNEAGLSHVLAHEKTHLKRRDHWWKPLGFVLLAVYWFNPAVWLAYILFCRDIELACDEKAVREYSMEEKKDYSRALLACSVSRKMVTACPLAFGETGVKERVKTVLYYKKPGFWAVVAAAVACVIVAVCFLTNPKGNHDTLRFRADAGAQMHGGWFDVNLDREVKSGRLYAEQWHNGECARSASIEISQDTKELVLLCSIVKDETDGGWLGVDIQIGPSAINRSDLLTRFILPENLSDGTPGRGLGFSFTSFEEGKYIQVAPGENRILAAMAFDLGNGVRSFSCEALEAEPERLENAEYLVVIRGIFSDEEIPAQRDEQVQGYDAGENVILPSDTVLAGDGSSAQGENLAERLLTLEDILSLSEKGKSLTWSDFEEFSYTETGSGLYIRVYETDSPFTLQIGGGSPGMEPMYIYLKASGAEAYDSETDCIDIRDEDVSAFIRAHSDLLLEYAIRQAVSDENRRPDSWEYACAESHVILGTETGEPSETGAVETVIVYAMALYGEYEIREDGIHEHAGSHMPVVLTFVRDDNGRYTLAEYWTPGEGSYYVSDIREKFPGAMVSDALDTQKYILAQTQDCYRQAVEYAGMDPYPVIERLLEGILSSPDTSSSPGDYEEAHSLLMRELTYYGDYTLRYIFAQFLDGDQTGLAGQVMADIMQRMSGNEIMGVASENGQQFFDMWIAKMRELDGKSGREWMEENAPFGTRCIRLMEEVEQERK